MSNLLKRMKDLETLVEKMGMPHQQQERMMVQSKPQSLSAKVFSKYSAQPFPNPNIVHSNKERVFIPIPPNFQH